jgi:hypothetical protein
VSGGIAIQVGVINVSQQELGRMTSVVTGGPLVNPHSEEVLLAGMNQFGRALVGGQQLHVIDFFSEYAPCGHLNGTHRCSTRLLEWSQTRWDRPRSVAVDVDTVRYSQFYPDSSDGRATHRSFHTAIARAVATNNMTRVNELGAFYFGHAQVQAVAVRHSITVIHTIGGTVQFPLP